jgi:hypothetical protein
MDARKRAYAAGMSGEEFVGRNSEAYCADLSSAADYASANPPYAFNVVDAS